MPSGLRVWLAFSLLCLAWGSSYLFIRLGLRQLTPLSLVALRLLVGAIVITVIAVVSRQDLHLSRRDIPRIVLVAAVNTSLPFWLISWGETTVPSGLASVLNSTLPIFSVLLAAAILPDEPLTPFRAGGVFIGFTGVVVLLSRDLAQGAIQWSALTGQGAIVLASLSYAVGAVLTRLMLRHLPSLTTATWALGAAALQMVVLSLALSPPMLTGLHALTILAVLWLGVLGSGVAYVLAYFILAQWGASRYTLVAYLLPVVGLTLGVIVLHEALSWRILAGTILVVGGIILASVTGRTPRSSRTTRALPAEGSQRSVVD